MKQVMFLALSRVLLSAPDLHRVRPYWRLLCRARVMALRMLGAQIADSAVVHGGVHVHRGIALTLGERAELRDRVRIGIDELGLRASSFALGAGSVVLSDTHIDCSAAVRIGTGTHIGRRSQLFTHTHDVHRRDVGIFDAPIVSQPVSIGDDVMLFNEVVVLPGVTVGNGAVVAVRAVVTRNVAPYAKVAGIPARQIGERS